MPWEHYLGLSTEDEPLASWAVFSDQIALHTSASDDQDESVLAAENIATFSAWRAKRDATRLAALDRAPSGDQAVNRARGLLRWRMDMLAHTPRGARDNELTAAIYFCGKFVNDGLLTEQEIVEAVIDAEAVNGHAADDNMTPDKLTHTVRRGLNKAAREGIHVDWSQFPDNSTWTANEVKVRENRRLIAELKSEAGESNSSGNRRTENDSVDGDGDEDVLPRMLTGLLCRSDLRNLPKPEPLIDNVLDKGTVAMLYGHRGTYKSFIALDWAASVATGRKWQTRATDKQKTLYIAAEGAFGFGGRVDAWETGWHVEIDDEMFAVWQRPVNLTRAADVADLMALVGWSGYGFIVVDTMARCMVGADENSAKDTGLVIDNMYRILDATPDRRGVVLGVHHSGKDKKTVRGSSALEDGVDTLYRTARDEMAVLLNREKRKDGPELDAHQLTLDPIPGTGSVVLKAFNAGTIPAEMDDKTVRLKAFMNERFRITGVSQANLRDMVTGDGMMSRSTFYRVVGELEESGWLDNLGSEKRPIYRVALPDD